jgi:cytochrome c-type biogenesis protein CcmH
MALWLVLALMTAAAMLFVLWPLGRAPAAVGAGSEVVVYRDQLQEVDRDRAAGLIGEAEAEAARVEVSRRLLAAAETQGPKIAGAGQTWRRRAVALGALLALPLCAGVFYATLGSPNLPGAPAASRVATPEGGQSVASLVQRIESHLERNPNDGRGWEVLAPVYMKLGRYDDAVKAWRNVLALNGPTAEREADLGAALVAAGNGVVTAEAKAAFERATARDAHDVKGRYFLGLAAEQDGNPEEAAKIWRALLTDAPSDAPWADFVRAALARVTGAPLAGPSEQDVAAAAQMSEEQRQQMVRGMVARLAERLQHDGSDVEGWLRLLRAYMVLGDRSKAMAAAADARRALGSDPDKLRRVEEFLKGVGLGG